MIRLRDVSFIYSGCETDGIRRINLEISKGECILLCGRSGCGKTTLTRLINGLIPAFYAGTLTGSVRIENQDVAELPLYKIAQRVGSVFQNPRTQFFNVDTDSEIAFGIENEGCPQERLVQRVRQTAEELHIENLRGRNIFELSGGEKQKIAFASVYAMNPDIYVLDEPSSNLDSESIAALQRYIRNIKAQGKTVIVAEHRLYYLTGIADKIVYMEKGEIAGIFTPAEFKSLTSETRHCMGLRAPDLSEVRPDCAFDTAAVQNRTAHERLELEVKNVSLYRKKKLILQNLSFSARAGEIIAITGANGAGKTTFVRALCGLHKETSGSFLWNGKALKPKDRLKRAYMVMQDVNYQLFAESVEAECSFGLKAVKAESIEAALDALHLSALRSRHPLSLSGGQKQRVAVARALLQDAPIIVLDEATAFADAENEYKIKKTFDVLLKDKTVIMIAHRLSSVVNADKICVIDEGRVAETGTHTELLERKGLYASMWDNFQKGIEWKV